MHIFSTLRKTDVQRELRAMIDHIQSEPLITVHTHSRVKGIDGFVGNFESVIEHGANGSGPSEVTIEHGVVIMATGGEERTTSAYLYGQDPRVLTQRQLEEALHDDTLALPDDRPGTVVMIQCVESRTPEHPYCSRVCCSQALKNAIALKERAPETNIFVLYRDIRSYGMREKYYQRARALGVVFLRYDLQPDENGHGGLPIVNNDGGPLTVAAYDTITGGTVQIAADLLALSVGSRRAPTPRSWP